MPAANASVTIFPFQPPFPTASNFPFQFDVGSQTSILMSESVEGFSVAAILQNPGKSLNCEAARRSAPPAVNAPAAIDCATVMVVSGNFSDARLSHELFAATDMLETSKANATDGRMYLFISAPRWGLREN